ncbi:MAG: hypothetical protein ONB55_21750 [candidate division KSB1 bacterium]|nr:hypothetical protein [candidate division KSB1 bacterium]
MAEHGISSSICSECRLRKTIEGEPVPCDTEDGLCWITKRPPDDDEAPMVSPWPVEFIIGLWERITALSVYQRIQKKRDEKTMMVFYLPTLEKLEAVFAEVDWETAPMDRFEAIEMLSLFHQHYINFKIS